MARTDLRLPENRPGDFFVDSTCIDCGACREIAPAVFGVSPREQSFVREQPTSEVGRTRALMALVACPTASIGSAGPGDARLAASLFPEAVTEDVEFCGFTSAQTFGASSYLIRRPAGNVLVDCPRASAPLMRAFEARGGIARLFLTHQDDVFGHDRFHDAFSCGRVLHAEDSGPSTRGVETLLEGRDPVRLADDLLALPVPGHTRGSLALLYRDRVLFTGDHLFATEGGDRLDASRSVCWYSWREQTRSMESLLDYSFEWVLPGHGRRFHAEPTTMRREIEALVGRMRRGGE